MLIGEQFLFLHIPKTAGKSLTKYMIEAWPGAIHGRVSPGQVRELAAVVRPGVTLEVASGHQGMVAAKKLLRQRGRKLRDMTAIFTCVRNPYDLIVSTYFFMRATFKNNRNRRNFQLAHSLEFEEFCNQYEPRAIEAWLTLNGRVPRNLRLLRFEALEADLAAVAKEYGFKPATLPHLNRTQHRHYSCYVRSAACERAIYEKHRYVFDIGLYERHAIG